MDKFTRYGRGGLLTLWSMALLWLIQPEGESLVMARFLNPSLWWLVSLGMWVSVCFVVVLFMTDNPGCHAVTNRLQSAVRMGIIAVPLFYLAVAGKGTLGSSAFDTRFIPDMLYPSTIEEADRQIDESGGMRTPSLMQLLSRPDDYHGREVEVVGMAARQEDLAPDLLLYRFFISCCVADAMPISILVSGKQLSDIENGAWLRIRGRSETIEKNGKRLPKIQVSAVETIEKPKMPYLFY